MECWPGGKAVLPLLSVVSLWLLLIPGLALAAGELPPASMLNYCSQPPFSSAGIKSNVLLMLDNSASMYDPAYSQKYCSGSTVACSNAECPSGQTCEAYAYCIDSSYQDTSTYQGYFDPGSIYSYDTSKGAFVAGATLPSPPCSSSSCAASTSFLYVEMGTASASYPFTRPVTSFRASGNFLNWLSMSKLDLEKRVLTGGKFQPDPSDPEKKRGWLQGENRGCQGKRFVKLVEGLPITFAVHGPLTTDLYTDNVNWDYTYDGGGASFIEIYDKSYNRSACLAAVNAWRSDSKDKAAVITQANACMGNQEEKGPGGILMSSRGQIYNRAMADCYDYLVNHVSLGFDEQLQQMCNSRAFALWGVSEMWRLTQRQWSSLDGICGRGVLHAPLSTGPIIDDLGFFGSCYSSLGTVDSQCITGELVAYCNQINLALVQDPSTAAASGTPGFIVEAGTSNLGGVSGKFNVRAYLAAPPSGLIQEFKNSLNFGAMVFSYGAGDAECSSGRVPCLGRCTLRASRQCKFDSDCQETVVINGKLGQFLATNRYGLCAYSNRDGGKIISYLNDATSVGDHGTGLIAAIDAITAANWTPFAESFYSAIGYFAHRTDLRLNSSDFDFGKPAPSRYSCQRNNILMVSDGMSSADSNPAMEALASLYSKADAQLGQDPGKACPPFSGSRSLDDLAWIAANRNIKTLNVAAPASTDLPAAQDQSITTHVVFTGTSNGAAGECDPAVLMQQTAARGGGIFANNSDPGTLYQTLKGVLLQIAEGSSSGADPSIVSTGTGNGALFLAEQYFPRKSFDKGQSSAAWLGEMQSLWYYIDPSLQGTGTGSTIREDSDGDFRLNLKSDRAVSYQEASTALFYDGNGDGNAEGETDPVVPDKVKALWRAGVSLWRRPAADRKIYTTLDGASLTSFNSLPATAPETAPKLLQASGGDEAARIISYVTGVDSAGYRSRSLTIPADTIPGVSGGSSVWKLGDIISSTARLQSASTVGSYHLASPGGYNDLSYRSFVTSKEYKSRGTVYVGANDGMLHAFNSGKLETIASGDVRAALNPKPDQSSSDFGSEQWAFIPRNALPYLTYLKEPLYQHIYYLDGPLTLLDASIGDTGSGACVKGSYWKCQKPRDESVQNSDGTLNQAKNTWRTILIGGMGLGGGTGECSSSSPPAPQCVPTPIPDPADASRRTGYSSYYALDVTDPDHPELLWEFSHQELGFATTGPAIVRLGGAEVNGRWLAVFGSGPTGPVRDGQFLGHSGRDLKFFVVDLRSGALITTIETGITEAFAGSLSGGAIDLHRRDPASSGYYQDDVLYAGYVTRDPVLNTWTRGGVGRIIIDNARLKANEPTNDEIRSIWHWSRVMGDSTGPVTTAIARLIDTRHNNLWLYFGTGRYFYRFTDRDGDSTGSSRDDWKGARAIYGVKDPCYGKALDGSLLQRDCSETVSGLTDQTQAISEVVGGWKIALDQGTDPNAAERVISNPVSTTGGAVFFASYQPTLTPCLPGNSYLWGVRYDTGAPLPAGSVKGKAILQLATGRPAEAGLSPGQRRSGPLPGRPVGLKLVSNSGLKPVKKIIHIQER